MLALLPRSGDGVPVIRSFADKEVEKIFRGERSRKLPLEIQPRANMKLFNIDQATTLEHLSLPPSNRLEALSGNLKGFWSIRINQQWRIVFRWNHADAHDVTITDYH
jgi:proteic killer suppression protein